MNWLFRCMWTTLIVGLLSVQMASAATPISIKPNILITTWRTNSAFNDALYCSHVFVNSIGKPGKGEITIGFDYTYDAGTQPFPCWEYSSDAFRGTVLFKVAALPENFKSARLIMKANHVGKKHSSRVHLITGMFHSSTNVDDVPNAFMTVIDGDQTTTGTQENIGFNPPGGGLIFSFPDSHVKFEKKSRGYTIDVTALVRQWANSNKTFQGFTFVGPDESLAPEKDTRFFARYKVTLVISN
ncbi:MAG: hypothetical protein WCE79_00185 [Xanthobacteraceae bacterium]